MRDHLLLYVNGQRHEVGGERAFESLADFLRRDLGLAGTKVVCAEGDCGSCSVLLGRVVKGRIHYHPVCSCIQFLLQLDGCHVITIEGLTYEGRLNPVQEALVRGQGSQCGFCTPGIVVSMCAMFEGCTTDVVRQALVGNLCRCTGYEPILRAGMEVKPSQMRPLNDLYPPGEMLGEMTRCEADPVLVGTPDGRTFFKPVTVAEACRFKAENPDCTVVSGATDLGVQVNKGLRKLETVLSLSGLTMLTEVVAEGDVLSVGACANIETLERACHDLLPEYARMLYWFGSPPIRVAATLAGNIANGSPIGDTMPALYVLNAEVELTGPTTRRRININDFYTGYRQNVMATDELITHVFIPRPNGDDVLKLYKVSRRKDLDISAFTAAFWMRVEDGIIREARVAYGGVGAVILRLPQTEAILRGAPMEEATFARAGKVARREVRPISDVRGSVDYRLQLAENVMLKLWHELSEGVPVVENFDGLESLESSA